MNKDIHLGALIRRLCLSWTLCLRPLSVPSSHDFCDSWELLSKGHLLSHYPILLVLLCHHIEQRSFVRTKVKYFQGIFMVSWSARCRVWQKQWTLALPPISGSGTGRRSLSSLIRSDGAEASPRSFMFSPSTL